MENQTHSTGMIAREYGPMVSSICRKMIRDPEMAEEAAQETWVEILRSIDRFRNESKLSTWIYTITRRVVIHYTRREQTYTTRHLSRFFRADEAVPDFPNPELEMAEDVKKQCEKCMIGILHCLDNESRMAYIMRDMVELPYSEIAEIFEKNESSIRKAISRSRNKLRRFLDNECYLFNPEGTCRCRMKRHVIEVDLAKEFEELRHSVNRMKIFKEMDSVIPGENFWKNFLI